MLRDLKPTDQTSGVKRWTILLLCVGTFLTAASLYIYVPILSPHAQMLGASLSLIGLIGGSYGFVQLLIRIPLGLLSDHGLRKPIIVASPLLAGLGCLGFGLFSQPESFVAWRALAGLGGAALVAFPPAFAVSLGPAQTTWATSLFTLSCGLGMTASAVVGGELAQRQGWQAPFFVGLALAAGGALVLDLASEHPSRPVSVASPYASGFLTTVRNPSVMLVVGLHSIASFAFMAPIFTFVPVRAVALGATRSELGILVAAATGAMTIAHLVCGTLLAGRLERRWVVALGLGLQGLGIVVLPWIDRFGLLITSQVVAGFGWGLILPALMAAVLDAAGPTQHGVASGVFQWGAALGTFGGPAIGGLIAQQFSLDTTFLVSGVLCLLAALYPLCRPLGGQNDSALSG